MSGDLQALFVFWRNIKWLEIDSFEFKYRIRGSQMIKATIQNGSRRTKIRFPCSEKLLSEKLGEMGVNPEHLSPVGTVIEIEPAELSVLKGFEVSLDALNYLGKRLDGICGAEQKQFLAVLSCDELEMKNLKNIINLTFNLPRLTLIEDADDLERAGLRHILNIRGGVPISELEDREWLAEEGRKLINSGKGFDTKYGKLFVNEEVPFEELFNGTTFPAYYYDSEEKAAVEISCDGLTELVELPCEDIAIKKAIFRLGADRVRDCRIEIDSMLDLPDEWQTKFREIERTKDIYGLNNLLKTADIRLQEEQSSIFNKEEVQEMQIIGGLK